VSAGALVPDEITIAMLRERLERGDAKGGVLLDGFPRTMEQAIALSEMMGSLNGQIDGVLYVDVPDENLIDRLSGRLICRKCQTRSTGAAIPSEPDRMMHAAASISISGRTMRRRRCGHDWRPSTGKASRSSTTIGCSIC
jgi:adenylate kinase family enzyme